MNHIAWVGIEVATPTRLNKGCVTPWPCHLH
jgi:hypothetical protein